MGFTLVELLSVIAILSILAALALPAYNNYTTKSKFSEVVLATAPTQTAISACAVSGDCVSGSAISLAASTSGGGTLFVPNRSNSLAVMTALEFAYNSEFNLTYTSAQLTNQAQANINAGFTVGPNPANPSTLCVFIGSSCYNDPVGYTSLAAFNQFYAPNAAIIAAQSQMLSLPCVGGSGCSPATKYVAGVSYNASGVITATAASSSGLMGETVILTPAYSGGRVDWVMSGSCRTRAGGALC